MTAPGTTVGALVLSLLATSSGGLDTFDAARTRALINELGAPQALHRIFGDPKAENSLADGIATGRRDWLAIAAELRPVSDAASAEVLCMAVQEALPQNAAGVLRLIREDGFTAHDACGMYGFGQIEDKRPATVILGLVDLRLAAVLAVSDKELADQRAHCLTELRRLRESVEKALDAR